MSCKLKPHELFDERTKIKEELENSFNDMNNFANNIEESIIVSENERKFVKLEDIFKRCIDDTEYLNEFIYSSQISILPEPIDFSLYEKKYAELRVDIDNKTSDDLNKLILEREKFIRETSESDFTGTPKVATQDIEELKREEIIREASEDLDFALSGVIEEILEERRVSSTAVIGESEFAIKLIGSFKNSNGELCDNGEINGDGYENQLFVGCQSNRSWFVSFVR